MDWNMTKDGAQEDWERLSRLIDRLLDLPATSRSLELEKLRHDAPKLAQRLDDYLRLGPKLGGFLDQPLLPRQAKPVVRLALGARIGPYAIVECLGYGGMGEVYLAQRVDVFEQRVAIKVVRWGKNTTDWILRFERERQLLARLAHPNIAGLLDGGRTVDGQPYLVMEFVDGVAVDQFVRDRQLTIPQTVDLFLRICRAVTYLHQNLVVHRDLKPSNVLVAEGGEPKLVDFGIAKSLGQDELDPTVTDDWGPPKTLLFSSPEQIRGRPITTASDVYSMGVLLSVVLTGETPYGSPRGDFWSRDELERAICQEPARPPSQIVAAGTEPLSRRFSRDLDSIVLKSLGKQPEERYESAEALAGDLRRFLADRPVRAYRGGFIYRTHRFLRSHRVAVLIVALILVSAVVSALFGFRALRERDSAIRARSQAQNYATFLEDLFKEAAPDRSGGAGLSALELLDRGRQKLLRPSSDGAPLPRELADLTSSLGEIYRQQGDYGKATELLDLSIERWRRIANREGASPDDALRLAQVLNQRSLVAYRQGHWERAEELIAESLTIRQSAGVAPEDLATAINNLATFRLQRGNYDEAAKGYLEVLGIRRRVYGETSLEVAASYYLLGVLEFDRGNLETAGELLRLSLQMRLSLLGPRNTRVATVRSSLGRVLQARGQLRDAEKELREALTIRQDLLRPEHQEIALSKRDIAGVLVELGQPATAHVFASEALESLEKAAPHAEFWIATVESALGATLMALDRLDEAEDLLLRSRETINRLRGPQSTYSQQATRRVEQLKILKKSSS